MLVKETNKPSNNATRWTKSDRKVLKGMVKEGKDTKEIAESLGRTPAAILYQKSVMGLVTKPKSKKVKVKSDKKMKAKTKSGTIEIAASISSGETLRDRAKDMASAARGIARANGKRITMAMFFVEDL